MSWIYKEDVDKRRKREKERRKRRKKRRQGGAEEGVEKRDLVQCHEPAAAPRMLTAVLQMVRSG